MITNRTIFNKIKKHLLTQKKKAQKNGVCLYRGNNGLKCAVGAIIKDKFYSEQLEEKNPATASVRLAIAKSLGLKNLTGTAIFILDELQGIHDRINARGWKKKLEEFAAENKDILAQSAGVKK